VRRFILTIVAAAAMFGVAGCGNLSPRVDPKLDQKLNNQNGKIGEIENLQNSMKGELGTLRSQADIQNSKLDRIQQGLLNAQQNNDNHGTQILSGQGGILTAVFAVFCATILVVYFRRQAKLHEKTASILAERIVLQDDPGLEDAVFNAVVHTDVAANTLRLFKKQKALVRALRQP
jgi:predicted PurR-regulated permease PerM